MSYSTELVELAIAGDKLAFEQLIKFESEKLYKIAYLHMCNKEMTRRPQELPIKPIYQSTNLIHLPILVHGL